MLDLSYIRANVDEVRTSIKRRGIKVDFDRFLLLDQERRDTIQQLETQRAVQNKANQEIVQADETGKKVIIKNMREVSDGIAKHAEHLFRIEQEFLKLWLQTPNRIAEEVHDGQSGDDNIEIANFGKVPTWSFKPLDHIELGRRLGIIDLERGVKIAGTRGYVLAGAGARLESALMRYGLDFLRTRGFKQINPPVLAKTAMFIGSGHFPGNEEETFSAGKSKQEADDPKDIQYLIGTGEVPLMGLHADEVLDIGMLPIQYSACTPCFRTEVGSYGKDAHGLYRVRQFQKVEQVVICRADEAESKEWFDRLLQNALDFVASLELPHRTVRYCAGDMSAKAYRVYDIETWMPSRNGYAETHTCSEILDYQTRRHHTTYKEAGKRVFPYSLNNTLVASPRILIPLLENHQQADGSVRIPEALRPYMDGEELLLATS